MARVSNQQVAQDFELRVQLLLENLGFKDIDGGQSFRLGGEQIDACGGFEDTLLVVECKTGKENKKSLLDPIRRLRGQMANIRTGVPSDPTYKRYKDVRFIIAAKFEARREDKEAGLSVPNQMIHVWDEPFLRYYERLQPKVGEYTKYNLLGELGVKPRIEHIASFPCLSLILDSKVRAFVFFAEPTQILRWAYVARREKGQEHYYQRILDSGKLGRIAKYVSGGKYFPNGVILAFNTNPQFKEFHEVKEHFPNWSDGLDFGSISFAAEYRSCWIIDGQHRLYGMGKSGVNTPVPIVALQDVTIADQAQLFLDINKNQKPVPPELVWDLEGEMRPDEPDGIIARVAKALNAKGLLAGRIYIPLQGPKKRGQLKLSGICAALEKQKLNQQLLRDKVGNPFFSASPDELVTQLADGLQVGLLELDKVFTDDQKRQFWLQNSGIAIFLALFERISNTLREIPQEFHFRKYFTVLKAHFAGLDTTSLRDLRQRCSSEGGRDNVIREFVMAIRNETGEEDFGGKSIPQSKLDKRITAMERALSSLIAAVLSKADANWFKARVDQQVQRYVEDKLGPNPLEPQKEFTFGHACLIIKRKDNWPLCEKLALKAGFSGLPEFDIAQQTVNKLRADIFHGKRRLTKLDTLLLEGYLGKFEALAASSP